MKSSTINLKTITLAKVLAEIHKRQVSGLLKIRPVEGQPSIKMWCWENKVVAVTGIIRLVEKIEYYNWLTPSLIVALKNENLYEKPIGEKLIKVYEFKQEQIEQLFQEQIKELYNLFSLDTGIAEFKKISNSEVLPYWEMTGCNLKVSTIIEEGLKQNCDRYLEELPETCLTINSTNSSIPNTELDSTDLLILKFANSNKTIKQIARELNIANLQLQQKIYFLQLMDIVEPVLPINRLLELTGNKRLSSSDNSSIKFEYRENWKIPFIAIVILNLIIILLTDGGIFEGVEKSLLDRFFRLRGTTANQDITLVTIDDEDIENFPTYPIADEYLAQTIQNIQQHEPIAIGLDLYRNIPQPPGHEKLLEVYRTTDNLIGVQKVAGNKVSPAKILAEKERVAFSDLIVDSDGIVRRFLMSVEDENGKINLSVGAYLALFTLSQKDVAMEQIDKNKYILGESTFEALTSKSGGYWQSNDFSGLQTLLNYQHKTSDFSQISFWDAYQNKIPTELIRNKIVIIGVTADSEKDFVYTPFSKNKTGLAEPIPGLVIHANIAAQFLNAARGEIPMLGVLHKSKEILLIISFSVIGIVIGIVGLALNLNITRENQPVILVIQTVVLSLILLSISYFCFLNGLWIPTITPIIAAIASLLSISFQYKQSLENLVYGDKVTKTANRKYFDKVFDKIFNAAKKENREIALVLCRINDLSSLGSKRYNQSLRKMAEAIGELLKDQNDLVARYDTNSLAVILQNVSHQEAELLVKTIGKNIKSQFKNSELKFDFELGFATSSDFSSPMDVLMLASNNLEPRG